MGLLGLPLLVYTLLMDKENTEPFVAPQTPHAVRKRNAALNDTNAAPKRVQRTYKSQHPSAIPFQPSHRNPMSPMHGLLDHIESLSLDPHTRERIVGMHKQASAAPPIAHRRRSILRWLRTSRRTATQRMTPSACAYRLRIPAKQLPLEPVRQLRVALASESPAWVHGFLSCGGYQCLLARLGELLSMEWREEQHDDMLLYEILRCMVALGSSEEGLRAMVSQAPAPYEQLMVSLLTGRLPSDLNTRRMVIVLLAQLLPQTMPTDVLAQRIVHTVPVNEAPCVEAASGKHDGAVFAAMLLHTNRPAALASKVDFLQRPSDHKPLRALVAQLHRICSEFFWIFCHKENKAWDWETLDLKTVMAPQVPSGMTGSVEWEAILYVETTLRLLNGITHSFLSTHPAAARVWMQELDEANLDQVLEALQLASQAYYTAMHAELAHFYALRRQVDTTAASSALPLATAAPPSVASEASQPPKASPVPHQAPSFFSPMSLPVSRPASSMSFDMPKPRASSHGTVTRVRHVSVERVSIPITPRIPSTTMSQTVTPPRDPLCDIDLTPIRF